VYLRRRHRQRDTLRAVILSALVLAFIVACAPEPEEPLSEASRISFEEPPSIPSATDVIGAGDFDDRLVLHEHRYRIVPAAIEDREHDSSDMVWARRIVYRVTVDPPALIGAAPSSTPSPRAELVADVTEDRIRGRFIGAGWPLEVESEVRIRRDLPGSYIFDHRGGRPLSAGQLRTWFIGDPEAQGTTPLRVAAARPEEQDGAGLLICRLVAEWAGQSPGPYITRCGAGGAPARFRVGIWNGRRTADVAVRLARSALRADHHDAPTRAVTRRDGHVYLSRRVAARILPHRGFSEDIDSDETRFEIINQESVRIIVAVEGAPLAWVQPGGSVSVEGLRPGVYRFGALRPMGSIALRYRLTSVPGELTIP
jgi:hypothetical protein